MALDSGSVFAVLAVVVAEMFEAVRVVVEVGFVVCAPEVGSLVVGVVVGLDAAAAAAAAFVAVEPSFAAPVIAVETKRWAVVAWVFAGLQFVVVPAMSEDVTVDIVEIGPVATESSFADENSTFVGHRPVVAVVVVAVVVGVTNWFVAEELAVVVHTSHAEVVVVAATAAAVIVKTAAELTSAVVTRAFVRLDFGVASAWVEECYRRVAN